MNSAQSKATTAKNEFLAADLRHDYSEAREKVVEHLNRYLVPAEDRAPGLQQFVQNLLHSINEFTNITTSLMWAILEVDSALRGVGIETITELTELPRVSGQSVSNIAQDLHAWGKKIESVQGKLEDIKWDETLSNTYNIGATVIDLRISVYEQFAVKSLQLELSDYDAAAEELLRESLKDKVSDAYDGLIKIAQSDEFKELLGEGIHEAVGSVVPFYKLGKAALKLHGKAKEIAEPYVPKGAIDELFDFLDSINETNEFARDQINLLKAQAVYISRERTAQSKA